MTFSKFSLITAICLGISGLVSCSGIESKPAESVANLPHTSTSGAGCISDGSFGEPQESAPIKESRQRKDDEAPQDDVGCIMPSVVE